MHNKPRASSTKCRESAPEQPAPARGKQFALGGEVDAQQWQGNTAKGEHGERTADHGLGEQNGGDRLPEVSELQVQHCSPFPTWRRTGIGCGPSLRRGCVYGCLGSQQAVKSASVNERRLERRDPIMIVPDGDDLAAAGDAAPPGEFARRSTARTTGTQKRPRGTLPRGLSIVCIDPSREAPVRPSSRWRRGSSRSLRVEPLSGNETLDHLLSVGFVSLKITQFQAGPQGRQLPGAQRSSASCSGSASR